MNNKKDVVAIHIHPQIWWTWTTKCMYACNPPRGAIIVSLHWLAKKSLVLRPIYDNESIADIVCHSNSQSHASEGKLFWHISYSVVRRANAYPFIIRRDEKKLSYFLSKEIMKRISFSRENPDRFAFMKNLFFVSRKKRKVLFHPFLSFFLLPPYSPRGDFFMKNGRLSFSRSIRS